MITLQLWYSTALETQTELLAATIKAAETELKETEAWVAAEAADYAREISPFWTGALSTSHITEQDDEMTVVYLNPAVRNPLTGDPPAEYGVKVHERDDGSAFYARTVEEYGPTVLEQGAELYVTRLELN